MFLEKTYFSILTKYGDFLWISAEHMDVFLNPLKSLNLVHEAIVPCVKKLFTLVIPY